MSDVFTALSSAMGISLMQVHSASAFSDYSNEEFRDDLKCIVAIGMTMAALGALAASPFVTAALVILGIVLVVYATYVLVRVVGESWARIYPGKK